MEELLELKQYMDSAKSFVRTKNYYFENHMCKNAGESKRVQLEREYKLPDDKVIRFGKCQCCGVIFYHETYESK